MSVNDFLKRVIAQRELEHEQKIIASNLRRARCEKCAKPLRREGVTLCVKHGGPKYKRRKKK